MRQRQSALAKGLALALMLVAVGLLTGSTAGANGRGAPVFTSGVASGDVTPTSAILWTRIDRDTSVKVEVWSNPALQGKKAFQQTVPHVSAARDFTLKVDATGLAPATTYFFRFRHGDGNGDGAASSDVGTFRTAPNPSDAADVRATYTGDADGTRLAGGAPAFNDFEVLEAARLEGGDFFVFDGDTIYSDSSFRTTGPATTLAEYHAAHLENRGYANLRGLLASTSVYATMDDHEVVNDYDGQTVDPARYAAGRQAFLDYYPVRESGLLNDATCAGAPLYRKFRWGSEAEVFLLDERSCRSPDAAIACLGDLAPTLPTFVRASFPFNLFVTPSPPAGCLATIFDPARTLLGPVQSAQLRADLLASTAKWKLVVSEEPIQQFHALPYDRWEGYAADRNGLLSFIQGSGLTGVKFLTTDTHATLQNQVAIDRFAAPARIADELVTGPIATNTFQAEVLALAGPAGLLAFNGLLTLDGVDCRNLNTNSYALVEVAAGAGTVSLTSKGQNGAAVTDAISAAACTATDGP
jgi:phosphodiesterase/alkaline phosphatase D-like protein